NQVARERNLVRGALEAVHQVASGVREDDDVADLDAAGEAQPPPRQELALDAVRADQIALDSAPGGTPARHEQGVDEEVVGSRPALRAVHGEADQPGAVAPLLAKLHSRRGESTAVEQRATRLAAQLQAARAEGLRNCLAARAHAHLSCQDAGEPGPASQALKVRVDVGTADDLPAMGREAEAVTLEGERLTATQQGVAVLAPEALPVLGAVEVAHGDAASDVGERDAMSARGQCIGELEQLSERGDAFRRLVAVEVEVQAGDGEARPRTGLPEAIDEPQDLVRPQPEARRCREVGGEPE